MDSLLHVLKFPYSVILASIFLAIAFAIYHFGKQSRTVRMLGSMFAARILLAVGAAFLAIEGTWSLTLHNSWAFVAFALLLLLSLAFTLLNAFGKKDKRAFLFSHLGIFVIIWASLFGSADVSRSKLIVGQGDAVNFCYMPDGKVEPLPFTVALEKFQIEYYPDGISPKQFYSHLLIDGKQMEVAVNSPVTYQGYTFFQESYDQEAGRYTILQVVRDPWLPIVYIGMALLFCGSLFLLFGRWKALVVVPITLLLTIVFTILTVAKINFGTLMPALRSWWFVPHLFIYMVAYSIMAIGLITWIVAKVKKHDDWLSLSNNLVRSSSALLVIGMLTGSIWARQAWGDYWAWDPKENWAAVTWFLSLIHLHLQDKRGWQSIVVLIITFLALQITWYGVNYLPSATDSLHTYNRG